MLDDSTNLSIRTALIALIVFAILFIMVPPMVELFKTALETISEIGSAN